MTDAIHKADDRNGAGPFLLVDPDLQTTHVYEWTCERCRAVWYGAQGEDECPNGKCPSANEDDESGFRADSRRVATIQHHHWTRQMRDRAMSEGAQAFMNDHPEVSPDTVERSIGLYKDVFEYEMAKRMVKSWDLTDKNGNPVSVAVGWPRLGRIGDAIVDAIGISDALRSFDVQNHPEVVAAKNSSSGKGDA